MALSLNKKSPALAATSPGEAKRVAQVDRGAILPDAQVDGAAGDLGNWETSGIIDVSILFGQAPGTLFIADVQAHGIREGDLLQNFVNIDGSRNTSLVEGGQLVFISVPEPAAGLVLLIGLAGVAARRSRG